MNFTNVCDIIQMIYRTYGEQIITDGKKLNAYFGDLAPKLQKEAILLQSFIECGGNQQFLEAKLKSNSEQRACIVSVATNMTERKWIQQDVAVAFCNAFFAGIGGSTELILEKMRKFPQKLMLIKNRIPQMPIKSFQNYRQHKPKSKSTS